MRYVNDPITQFDGSGYAAWNCVAATAAALADIATVGRIHLSAAAVRRASGITDTRGLYQSEAADAVVELSGVVLESRFLPGDGTQRGKLRAMIAAGRAAGVMIDTNVTAGTAFRTGGLTYTFRGLHEIVLAGYRWRPSEKPQAEFYGDDPGDQPNKGWRWWPADLVYRAAERAGGGGIWVFIARDTEGVKRACRRRAVLRSNHDTDSANLGTSRVGRIYYVVETTRGGRWFRPDGSAGAGWHRLGSGKYLRGDALA